MSEGSHDTAHVVRTLDGNNSNKKDYEICTSAIEYVGKWI